MIYLWMRDRWSLAFLLELSNYTLGKLDAYSTELDRDTRTEFKAL